MAVTRDRKITIICAIALPVAMLGDVLNPWVWMGIGLLLTVIILNLIGSGD